MEEKNKISFKFMNMNISTNVPIFKENRNGEWIDYGKDNLYPQLLLDIYHNRSNKHKAIINRKAKMIAGNGFEIIENPSIEYTKFINNIFGEKTLEQISLKLAYDLEIYGGFSTKIKWSRDLENIASVDYLPFQKVRLATETNEYYVSKDWKNYRKKENTPEEICGFSIINREQEPEQLYYYVEEQPGMDFYPLPTYSSTLNWIECDYEISNFHLSAIINGFSAGFIINFATGIPSDEEMDIAYKQFQKKYTGTSNGNTFIMTFSDGADGKPELTPLEMNATDERFISLANQIKEEIFIGHEVVSPMLFGVRTEGQLGGRDEMIDSMELFQTVYIDFQQNKIETYLNKLAKQNGVKENIKLKRYSLFDDKNKTIK